MVTIQGQEEQEKFPVLHRRCIRVEVSYCHWVRWDKGRSSTLSTTLHCHRWRTSRIWSQSP